MISAFAHCSSHCLLHVLRRTCCSVFLAAEHCTVSAFSFSLNVYFHFLDWCSASGGSWAFYKSFFSSVGPEKQTLSPFFFFMSGLFCVYTDWLQASRDVWLRSHIDWEVTRSLDSFDGCHPLSLPPCGPTEGNQFLVKWQQAVQHLIAPRVFIYRLWCHR